MLGDCHMHMVLDGVYWKNAIATHRGRVRDDIIMRQLGAYADRGVTFLRDGGDAFGVCSRAKALAGDLGITYIMPTTPLCLRGRYGAFIGTPFDTMTDYRRLVAQVKRDSGDFIKIMISGIMDFDHYGSITSEPLSGEQIREMIHIAHGEGFAVMAHANGPEVICRALEAGVDSIEHGAYMDETAVRMLAQSEAVWVPTLVTVGNLIGDGRYPDEVLARILDMQLQNVALCAQLGGTIALGSDAGAYRVMHGQGTLDEYALLRQALGTSTDTLLETGERRIRQRFCGT